MPLGASRIVPAMGFVALPLLAAPALAEDGSQSVQLGPRPFYLVEDMDKSDLKSALQACAGNAFAPSDFSIGHRGAPLQFPEHTRESYTAAARMGAGIVECDVTFTKDRELVCRHAQPHAHFAVPDRRDQLRNAMVRAGAGTDDATLAVVDEPVGSARPRPDRPPLVPRSRIETAKLGEGVADRQAKARSPARAARPDPTDRDPAVRARRAPGRDSAERHEVDAEAAVVPRGHGADRRRQPAGARSAERADRAPERRVALDTEGSESLGVPVVADDGRSRRAGRRGREGEENETDGGQPHYIVSRVARRRPSNSKKRNSE
jgi:hypothetical protein